MTATHIALYYLLGINVLTMVIMGIDKLKARKGWWRIPESTLLLLAVIGGSIGELFAMQMFRHKTRHKKFFIGVPLILLAQIMIFFFIKSYIFNCVS